jgi:glycosyltransferase involved in cell wall biosynthesis
MRRSVEGMMVDISLVIPAYNEERYLKGCLDSVFKNAASRLLEIIVVDNGSTDRTAEIAESYTGVRVVYEPNVGVTRAKQRGLEEARGSVIAFIDADTLMPEGWIDIVEQTFSNQADVACLSGPCHYYDGPPIVRTFLNALNQYVLPLGYLLHGHMLIGGNFVVQKAVLEAINGFDPTIDFWGEDADLGRRIAANKKNKFIFRRNFNVQSSVRRFEAEGLFITCLVYGINYLWVVFFNRPYSNAHANIRLAAAPEPAPASSHQLPHRPV